jgi:hypothetical protein
MVDPVTQNEILLAMMDTLVGPNADLELAETAFRAKRGDFAARFTAAVEALFARLAQPEVFIDIPAHPEDLTKSELDALVRPAPAGFLRSYPSKGELLEQVGRIKQRQERRPAWIPRIDRHGNPLPLVTESEPAQDRPTLHPRVVTSFPELGEVTINLLSNDDDRPELPMAAGGIGELEAVLHTVLTVTGDNGPCGDVRIDARANEALVPEEARWWAAGPASSGPPRPVSAAHDPGVASELLATSATLGGLPVADGTQAGFEVVVAALVSAGDWRHGRRWLLDAWHPGDDVGILATAQAAIAGWADESHSGLIVYVYGGALHGHDGLLPMPAPLHGYLLCVTRSANGTDAVEAVHRLILSCPGDHWCHRGGCAESQSLELDALLALVVTSGNAAAAVSGGWAWDAYQKMYGATDSDEYTDSVLECLEAILLNAGWTTLEDSVWEGGMQESLLRRGQHCLTARYDPFTRQLQLADGKSELESVLQLLADDGLLSGEDGREVVDINEEAVRRWGSELLTAADDMLRGRISAPSRMDEPVQSTVLGLHPHADGSLRTAASITLADEQLTALLRAIGVLPDGD